MTYQSSIEIPFISHNLWNGERRQYMRGSWKLPRGTVIVRNKIYPKLMDGRTNISFQEIFWELITYKRVICVGEKDTDHLAKILP